MQALSGVSTIIPRYDAILMDLWGVVHDGTQLYPGVHETLVKLRQADKKIIMLSNAPRRANKAAIVLNQLGVGPELYDYVVTSGEVGYQWLALTSPSPLVGEGGVGGNSQPTQSSNVLGHPPLPNPPPQGGRGLGKKYYYIGPSKDADILDGLDYRRVDDLKDADFLLNVGFGGEEESLESWEPLLRAAKAAKLPMLCLNPDMEVVKITGERYACAGVLAADYARLGAEVKYFGKPFPEVYERCRSLLQLPKEKILAIGDGIATDIAGAVKFGIDSALVTGGILNKSDNVQELCRKYNAVPTYVIPRLAW